MSDSLCSPLSPEETSPSLSQAHAAELETLLERIRQALDEGRFDAFYQKYREILGLRI